MIQIQFYQETVDKDFERIARTVLPVTAKEVQQLKQSYLAKYLRYYVQHRLNQYMSQHKIASVYFPWSRATIGAEGRAFRRFQ